jgi:hypothetical protein
VTQLDQETHQNTSTYRRVQCHRYPSINTKSTKQKNLTLHNWIDTVFPYVNKNKNLAHTAIAKHFATLPDGALKFNATTWGRKLDMHQELKARCHAAEQFAC